MKDRKDPGTQEKLSVTQMITALQDQAVRAGEHTGGREQTTPPPTPQTRAHSVIHFQQYYYL